MQDEIAGAFQTRSRIVLAEDGARILHVAFARQHHRSHGPQMTAQVKADVAAERPNGVLVDLLQYEYKFGNDVCGLFTGGYDKESRVCAPTCIVAIGRTRTSMESLYTMGNFRLGHYLSFAASVAEGVAWLAKRRGVDAAEQGDDHA